MEKKVEINGKAYVVKEMPYIAAFELDQDKKAESARLMLKKSVGLTDEEINALSMKEGLQLQKYINEVNGLDDFQKLQEPSGEKKE